MHLLVRSLITAALALATAACGTAQPSQPVTITLLPGSPPPVGSAPPVTTLQPAEPTPTLGEATAEIELTITGGPAEGSYRAVIHGTSCIKPDANQMVANYADPTAADGFTRLDLDVRDITAATDEESDDFLVDLTVGGTTYQVDPRAGTGEGTVLMEIDPLANATLDLLATAADGAEIELSLLCDVESL